MFGKNFILYFLLAGFIFSGCSSDKKSKKQVQSEVDKQLEVEDDFVDEFNKAKQVFYALPSPIETAMLIKRAGTEYDASYLNPVENASNYTTNKSKALNFGVYGADLSYASLFSQTQTAIQYMAVSKKLADEMGILGFLDEKIVERMENNVNNRDSSMAIITEGFISSNTYLKEAGRAETASLIIAGGWVEGLYIATRLTKQSPNNNELIDRIIDQKLSLTNLISLLETYKNNPDIKSVLEMFYQIQAIYDKIQVVTSKVEPITDEQAQVTTLQAKTEIFISDEVFNDLCQKVDSIRDEIVGI